MVHKANIKPDGTANEREKRVTVFFNPESETGGINEEGSKERPSEIGLVHELKHAKNRINGVRYNRPSSKKDPETGVTL